MSYGRAHGTGLRVFVDAMNAQFSRGYSRVTEWTERNTGDWDYNSADKDNKYTLIDGNPLKICSFNTSAQQTGHIMYENDAGSGSGVPRTYAAILGHNALSAEVAFRIAYHTSTITNPGDGTTVGTVATPPVSVINGTINPDSGAVTDEILDSAETDVDVDVGTKFTVGEMIKVESEVMEVTGIAGNTLTVIRGAQGSANAPHTSSGLTIYRYNVIQPTSDGDTIITFTEQDDKRYFCLETIPSDGVMSGTDFEMGVVLIGMYHDFSIAPDLSVKHGFISSGVTKRKTPAGKSFNFAHHLSANDSTDAYSPFRRGTYWRRIPGREHWDLTWKGDEDTNIYPADISAPNLSAGTLIEDFIQKIGVNFLIEVSG